MRHTDHGKGRVGFANNCRGTEGLAPKGMLTLCLGGCGRLLVSCASGVVRVSKGRGAVSSVVVLRGSLPGKRVDYVVSSGGKGA